MNIKFSYLYCDGGNYKQYNAIVFANPNEVSLQNIQSAIAESLLDGNWFVAEEWNVPDLHFKQYEWGDQADHEWHEFTSVEETSNPPTEDQSIEDLMETIKYRRPDNNFFL